MKIPDRLRDFLQTLGQHDADEICEWLDETPNAEVEMVQVIVSTMRANRV